MSTFTPTQFTIGTLVPSAVTVLYQVPASAGGIQITAFTVTNTDGSNPHTVSIWLAPNSAVPTDASLLISVSLAAGESRVIYQAFQQVLTASQTIQAEASSSGFISAKISGLLITG